MEFKEFKQLQDRHINQMFLNTRNLFEIKLDKDEFWNLYLDSFPEGTNNIYKERREFDCSCCKQFIRQFGNVVIINPNYSVTTIWDFETGSSTYQPVLNVLSNHLKELILTDVFLTKESRIGTPVSRDLSPDSQVIAWNHFSCDIPKNFRYIGRVTVDTVKNDKRTAKEVLMRSLEEITTQSVEDVLDMIVENTLYKGEEWTSTLKKFFELQKEYRVLPLNKRNNFCWVKSLEVGPVISKIRNHSIGVLLVNLSNGMDIEEAVGKYETIVAPHNYKRPKSIYTESMKKQAFKTVQELGLENSLGHRHANLSDISVNNVLWANRDAVKSNGNLGIFDVLEDTIEINPKKFENVQGINIVEFMNNILPTASSIELLVENRFEPNFMSLIAPVNTNAKSPFKWNNGFSWAYNGNITDSDIRQRVASFGGKVDNVFARFSIQWEHSDDLDAHCIEPNGNEIYFSNKGFRHRSSGELDVDMIPLNMRRDFYVENITYLSSDNMLNGTYQLFVHNFDNRDSRTGFQAEFEYNGQTLSFKYDKSIPNKHKVVVLEFEMKNGVLTIFNSLPSTISSKEIWNVKTNQFHQISSIMYSPNYWNGQGVGNRHYLFMLANCQTHDRMNGFFNEFLNQELSPHRKVFEALAMKTQVEPVENQLSGLGFSSTQKNYVICRVNGNNVMKVIFS